MPDSLRFQAAHQFALHQVGDALGILRGFCCLLELVGQRLGEGEDLRVVFGDAVFLDHAGAAGLGEFGQGAGDFGLPLFVDYQREQVGLGEIAIVVRLFFRAHAVGLAFVGVVEARLLCDLAAGFDDVDLASDFVFQRFADEAERIYVFDFCFGAELFLAAGTHADVGIAAQGAFFHVAVADAGVEDDLFQASQIFVGFVGRGEVGLADDFDQGDAGAIEIDGRFFFGIGETFVQALAGVFFEVDAGDADFLLAASEGTSMKPNSASGLSYCEIWYPLGRSG